MKRKVWRLALAVLLLAGSAGTVHAAEPVDGGTARFGDNGMESEFHDSTVRQEIGSLLPGDSMTVRLKLENQKDQNTDWYMTNQVLRSLEDSSSEASGGAYTYELVYTNDATGASSVLYSSQSVGGGDSREGLREVASAMDGYFYLDRLGAGESGHLALTIALDPETVGNTYQNTLASLQMAFAVDVPAAGGGSGGSGNSGGSGGVGGASGPASAVFALGGVQTGDQSGLAWWSLAALVSGLLLLILAVVFYRKERRRAQI